MIKKECTLRKRLAITLFLKSSCNLASSWSKERNADHLNHRKPIALQVSLETTGYREAYQWLKITAIKIIIKNKSKRLSKIK